MLNAQRIAYLHFQYHAANGKKGFTSIKCNHWMMKGNEFLERNNSYLTFDISCDNNLFENLKLDLDSLTRKMNSQKIPWWEMRDVSLNFFLQQQSLVNRIKYCYSFETTILSITSSNRCIMQTFKLNIKYSSHWLNGISSAWI